MTKSELTTAINKLEKQLDKSPTLEKILNSAIIKAKERVQHFNDEESYKKALKNNMQTNSIFGNDFVTDNQRLAINNLISNLLKENNYNPDNLLIFKSSLFTDPVFFYYSLSSNRMINVSEEQLNYLRDLISISKKRQYIYIDNIKCFFNLKFGNSFFVTYENSSIENDGGILTQDRLIEIELNGNVFVHTKSYIWKNWFLKECKEVDFMTLESKSFHLDYDEYFLIEVSSYGDTNLIDSFLNREERYAFLPLISKQYEIKEFK
jgi:hypothetical protein